MKADEFVATALDYLNRLQAQHGRDATEDDQREVFEHVVANADGALMAFSGNTYTVMCGDNNVRAYFVECCGGVNRVMYVGEIDWE